MLGHKVLQELSRKFYVWGTIRGKISDSSNYKIFENQNIIENIEVENFETVEKVVKKIRPDVIINAIGVIKQLPSAKNVIKTLTINSIFPHQLSQLAIESNARLITISTDCVFNGKKGNYIETDVSDAIDLYGKSKNLGEVISSNCLTLRTSIIGRELGTSHSLVEWFLNNDVESVKGFTKAIYSGFPTIILSEIISDVIEKFPDLQGLYHVSSEPINKYDLLNLVKKAYGKNIEIIPFDDFVIDRSLDSTEFREATGFQPESWQKMIERMAADNFIYEN